MIAEDFIISYAYREDVQATVAAWCKENDIRRNRRGAMDKSTLASVITRMGKEAEFFKLEGVRPANDGFPKRHDLVDRRSRRIKPGSSASIQELTGNVETFKGLRISYGRHVYSNPDKLRPDEED
jgi:hypothetical protein